MDRLQELSKLFTEFMDKSLDARDAERTYQLAVSRYATEIAETLTPFRLGMRVKNKENGWYYQIVDFNAWLPGLEELAQHPEVAIQAVLRKKNHRTEVLLSVLEIAE